MIQGVVQETLTTTSTRVCEQCESEQELHGWWRRNLRWFIKDSKLWDVRWGYWSEPQFLSTNKRAIQDTFPPCASFEDGSSPPTQQFWSSKTNTRSKEEEILERIEHIAFPAHGAKYRIVDRVVEDWSRSWKEGGRKGKRIGFFFDEENEEFREG